MTVTGGNAAAERLRTLPAKLQAGVLYVALHRAAAVLQQAVQAAAPVGTEPTRKTRPVRTSSIRLPARRDLLQVPQSVSYDYGRLRANIRRRRANLRASGGEIAVSVTRGRAFWAFFLEKGTRRMRARPFWQQASRGAEAAARAEFERAFHAAVQRAVSRAGGTP